jgi:hypothetical protein
MMHLKYGISAVLSILIWTTSAMAWGQNGHRIVGRIAENHLTPEARQAVAELIGPESLAQVSTWADEIKSDRAWRHANPWHYINVEAGETFENAAKNPNGDIIESLARFEQVLRDSGSSRQAKAEALKFIVHFVGDIHQPLHAGSGKDRGGNDIKVRWFGEPSNLHAVWDTELIEYESMGYTEFVEFIDHATEVQINAWQQAPILEWARESRALLEGVYDVGSDQDGLPNLRFYYVFKNKATVQQRLLQAGIRLAGVLNAIFT